VSLEATKLNLDTGELDLADDEEGDDDEDISIIDFGGEDFVEPTDIIESIDEADDSAMMDVDIDEDDDVKTGTFAPGDFEEPTAAVDSLDDIDDLMLPDDVDEVSTKLDLARAFIDMGDNEGARGSLEEVIAEGNEDQKAEAKSLLDQI
jgi:pilus assembly protein FimV